MLTQWLIQHVDPTATITAARGGSILMQVNEYFLTVIIKTLKMINLYADKYYSLCNNNFGVQVEHQ